MWDEDRDTYMSALTNEWVTRDDLEKAAREALTQPSHSAMWDDRLYRTHGPVVSWCPQGDDLLSLSNFVRIGEDLTGLAGEEDDGDVFEANVGHWLVGSLAQLWVRVRDESGEFTPAFCEAVAIAQALDAYPVYDEDDYSRREWEAFEETVWEALECAARGREEGGEVLAAAMDAVSLDYSQNGNACRAEDVDWDELEQMLRARLGEEVVQ